MPDNPMVKESKTEIQIKWQNLAIKLTTTSIVVAIALGSLALLGIGIYEFGPRAHDTVESEAESTAPASAPKSTPRGATPTAPALPLVPTGSLAASATSPVRALTPLSAASESDDSIKQNDDGHYNQNHVDIKRSKLLPGTRTPAVTQEMRGSHNVNSVVVE